MSSSSGTQRRRASSLPGPACEAMSTWNSTERINDAHLELLVAVLLRDAIFAKVQAAAERVGVALVAGWLLLCQSGRHTHLAQLTQLAIA